MTWVQVFDLDMDGLQVLQYFLYGGLVSAVLLIVLNFTKKG